MRAGETWERDLSFYTEEEAEEEVTPFTGATVTSIRKAGDVTGKLFNRLWRIAKVDFCQDRVFIMVTRLTKAPPTEYLTKLRFLILDPLRGVLADVGIARIGIFPSYEGDITLITQPFAVGHAIRVDAMTTAQLISPAGHHLQELLSDVMELQL